MSNQLDQIDRLLDSSLSTFNTSELQSENKMKERLIQVVAGDESKEYFGHPLYTTSNRTRHICHHTWRTFPAEGDPKLTLTK